MRSRPTAAAIGRQSTKRAGLLSVAQLAPDDACPECFWSSCAFGFAQAGYLTRARTAFVAGLSASFERWATEGGASTKETVIEYDKIFAVSTEPTPGMCTFTAQQSTCSVVDKARKLSIDFSVLGLAVFSFL